MCKPIYRLRRCFAKVPWPASALLLACLLAPAPAQAASPIVINSASFDSLATALDTGGTIQLNFNNGTITVQYPLEVAYDTFLDASTNTVTISGGNSNQLFHVEPGVTLKINNVTLSGGNLAGTAGAAGSSGNSGANIGTDGTPGGNGFDALGGAIFNEGNLQLYGCVLSGNSVVGGAGGAGGIGGDGSWQAGNGGAGGNGGNGFGGAVYNAGTLFMTNCSVAGNTATGGAGGAGGTNGNGGAALSGMGGAGSAGAGAGIYNAGSAIIANCTFNQNTSQGGFSASAGGLQNNGVGQNGYAGGNAQGAGLYNLGTNTIVNSTFWKNNDAGGNGGNGAGAGSGGYAGNGGNGGSAIGGNIYNASTGALSITNCTIVAGSTVGGTGGAAGGSLPAHAGSTGTQLGANIANNGGSFSLKNSILALPTNAPNSSGAIIDLGNNRSSDTTPAFTTTNSLGSKDSKVVTPPAAHGGPTLTISLQNTSPAIDAIFDNSAPPIDQRGVSRPIGLRSDIGAFEFGVASNSFTISGTVMVGTNRFSGVTVMVGSSPVTSDANGFYSVFLPGNLAYNVTPQPAGYFSPSTTSINLTADSPNINFVATNAPTFIQAVSNTNKIQITFSAVPTFTYRIQASTNLLASTNWITIATNTATNSTIIFTDSLTNFARRFYRAVTP